MLVSVYIPTKNRRVLVERAVRSVLDQDHADLEVFVVNDASTDDTEEFLHQLSASDPRLTVFTNSQSQGAPVARNRAIAAAKGEFITGLDDDDYVGPSHLTNFITAWKRYEAEGVKPSCLYANVVWMQPARVPPMKCA